MKALKIIIMTLVVASIAITPKENATITTYFLWLVFMIASLYALYLICYIEEKRKEKEEDMKNCL